MTNMTKKPEPILDLIKVSGLTVEQVAQKCKLEINSTRNLRAKLAGERIFREDEIMDVLMNGLGLGKKISKDLARFWDIEQRLHPMKPKDIKPWLKRKGFCITKEQKND